MEGQISSRVILKHFFTPNSKAVSYTESLKYHTFAKISEQGKRFLNQRYTNPCSGNPVNIKEG